MVMGATIINTISIQSFRVRMSKTSMGGGGNGAQLTGWVSGLDRALVSLDECKRKFSVNQLSLLGVHKGYISLGE